MIRLRLPRRATRPEDRKARLFNVPGLRSIRRPKAPKCALALSLAVLLCTVTQAMAQDSRYVAVIFGSRHIGNDQLNDATPGLTFGLIRPLGNGIETFAEAGIFYNSYREIAPLAVIGRSAEIASIGSGRLRVGAGIGLAYYGELAPRLKADYGIPNIGGVIPIVTASLALRLETGEWRLTAVPPGDDTTAIFNLSFAQKF